MFRLTILTLITITTSLLTACKTEITPQDIGPVESKTLLSASLSLLNTYLRETHAELRDQDKKKRHIDYINNINKDFPNVFVVDYSKEVEYQEGKFDDKKNYLTIKRIAKRTIDDGGEFPPFVTYQIKQAESKKLHGAELEFLAKILTMGTESSNENNEQNHPEIKK